MTDLGAKQNKQIERQKQISSCPNQEKDEITGDGYKIYLCDNNALKVQGSGDGQILNACCEAW